MLRGEAGMKRRGVFLTFLCFVLAAIGAAGCARQPDKPNIVLVVLDVVRADYTGLHPGAKSHTPTLDRLAAANTNFVNSWATAPWTLPSHASIFTGALPSRHGCSMRNFHCDTDMPTLARILGEKGYETAAFFSNPWLSDEATGMLRGFAVRREAPLGGFMNRPSGTGGYQGGRAVLGNAGEWLRGRSSDRPFFLFVNFLEAHLPYDPPAEYRAQHLQDLPDDDQVTIEWGFEFNAGLHPSQAVDWERVRRLYGGDVNTSDRLLAGLLQLLERQGLSENTILIVTSDHGENLGEHGLVEHQFSVHESLLSVPLVISAPGRLAPGVRQDPVMLTDLFATILDGVDAEGVTIPPSSRSLLLPDMQAVSEEPSRPLFAEYAGPHRSILELLQSINPQMESARLAAAYRTVRVGEKRLTVGSDGSVALHDLIADPQQRRNLAGEMPQLVASLRQILEQALTPPDDSQHPEYEIDEATREKLRALGYIR
jgi:arylsulfatase A-like enzyme